MFGEEGSILGGPGHRRLTIASILAITGLLLAQTVDQALAGTVLPSGAGTLTIGPQAMEGNLQIHPGDTIKAGYDFTMPGAHAAAQVTVDNASITMALTCSNGTTPPAISFALPVQTYSDPAGSPSWYPSGDQSSVAVYQGSARAPDLCAGGIMSGANGATFRATIFSTDTTDKVNFRFHYSDNTAGSWSATITASPTPTAKTVLSATLTPSLGLTLAVDHSSAIPGDTLTYSGTVTNTGATLTLTGDFTASASGSSTATVESYWDDIATSLDSANWTALAGAAATQSGYTPAVGPPISSGMTLTSTPVAAAGITYPTSGDPLLGTTLASGSSALWHYTATVPLTPSQVTTLLDPTKVKAVRNSFHLEVSPANPSITQPSVMNVDFSGIFFGGSPAPSGAVTIVTIAVQPPSGSPIAITSAQVSALASVAPGASVNYSASYQVPVVTAKGTTETDDAYKARLKAIEGSTLTATASSSGSSTGGNVTTGAPAVNTTEHLPILTIAKSGPATVPAGTSGTYPLALQNTGGAPASGMAITDSVPSGATGTVSGVPTILGPGGVSSGTQATFLVPVNQSAGSLTDTASLNWQDANGNAYGPVSSMFTTQVQAANKLSITGGAGPNPTGATEAIKATLVDLNGQPVGNQNVFLNVTGANTQQSTVTTDASGVATFSYLGANAGTDTVQASTSNGVQSNTLSVTWFTPIQKVSSTAVQGNFYAEPSNPQTFVVTPQSVPDFGQSFPTIDFNPPTGTIPHSPAGAPTDQTRPLTDVTTDINGNYNGTIVAQGANLQAGLGNLLNFDAVFTANLIVAQPGDVTFNFHVDDGFLFGVGNGATRVSGAYENPPASNASAIHGYPLVGSLNLAGAAGNYSVTVHFPTAGTFPYELDYFEANAGALSLTMSVATFNPQTNPLSIYVGYADGLRAAGSIFPFPWLGSPNVNFIGCCPAFDAGAIRFDNSSSNAITLDSVTVDVGSNHFDLWGRNLTVPANQILILSQTGQFNFDTSDFSGAPCGGNNGVIPKVNVTQGGVTTSFNDTNQILNTFGFDLACRGNESQSWQRIGGGGSTINVPLPPATALALTPATVTGNTVGQTLTFTVSAMDATGQPVANLPVTLTIAGANGSGFLNGTLQVNGTTDSAGIAKLSYVGRSAGTDTAQVTASVMGLQALSNTVSVPWSLSPTPGGGTAPAPAITSPSPPDGTIVTKPVPISASFAPPAGQAITSWSVSYQDQDPSAPVTLASGTGTPPATLAVFDPTLLPNDAYLITISATASGGGTQTLTTSVIVYGNLKLGRYVTSYQDLSVPVNGFQMEVRRIYDSIDKHVGDFGVGWHVELANFRVTTNRQLGAGGWSQYNSFCGFGLCLTAFKTSAPHFVTVMFPDGHQDIFDFTPTGGTNVFLGGGAAFTARPGTTSTLQVDGDASLSYRFDGNLYGANGPFNPTRFKLTTHDGHVLLLDTTTGLVSETDRNGNSVSVDANGVHASNGQSITYTRDSSGRITQITGPGGQLLSYTYSAAGDLASSTDPDNNTASYTYDASHRLLSVAVPAQTRPLTTLIYDSSGRLVTVTDGNGNASQIGNNVAGQRQTVTDATGRLTTVYTLDDLGDVLRQDQVFDGRTLTTTATYDPVGRPLSRTDPLGRTWSGSYDANGNLLQLSTPQSHAFGVTYDSFGDPLTFTDPVGNLTKYTYDSLGNLTTFTDALGKVETYTYDAQGHTTSRTDALGHTWSYTFDAAGHKVTMADPIGNITKYGYDATGNLTSTTDPTGAVTTYAYDAAGNLRSTKDALGQVSSLSYDSLGRVVARTDPGSNTTAYGYDGANALTSVTDPVGRVTRYGYDLDNRLTTVTDPAGGVTTYSYDGSGRLISEKDAIGRVTSYLYDDAGRLTSKTMPNGGVFTYLYNSDGYQTSVADPLGHTTTTSYDGDGHATSTTDALGKATTFNVDALGRVTQTTDPLGLVTSQTYDAAGRLSSSTDGAGNTTTYGYDGAGNRTVVTDPLGHATTSAYDPAGRLLKTTDPLARSTTLSYDALGRMTALALPSGVTTSYTYDSLGHETSVKDAVGGTSRYTYDAAGQRLTAVDPRSNSTSYGYDAAGRLTTITDALNGKVSLAYDLAGQQTSIVNPRGDTTAMTYDALGDPSTQTDPAGKVTTFAYDAAGRMTSKTDPRGTIVTAAYDAANRLTSTGFPGGTITSVYDSAGRRTSMTDPTGTTTFSFDAASNVTAVAAPQGTVTYSYDAAGRRISMTLPGPRKVAYAYDAGNQLTSVADWLGQSTTFGYGPDGQLANVARPGGLSTTYGYDGADRLTSVNSDGPGGALKHFSYTLDANGNRTSVTSAAGTESYSLDALNRITQATYPNGDRVVYGYDAAGNRTSQTVNGVTTTSNYDASGRLVQVGATTYSYDADGNLTGAGADSFSWDWAGRLSQSTVGGATSSYIYDGDGVRVGSQSGGRSTNYLWDRQNALPLLADDGSHAYVQSLAAGTLEQLDSAGTSTALFPVADALGSVRGLTNSGGMLAGSTDYDVFGAIRSTSGSSSIFGFTGEQTDATGLLYLRARYMNPQFGRFLSPDSVFPSATGTQGYNLYGYVTNNPTSSRDPGGQLAVETAIQETTTGARTVQSAGPVGPAVNVRLLLIIYAFTLGAFGCILLCPYPEPSTQAPPKAGPKPPAQPQPQPTQPPVTTPTPTPPPPNPCPVTGQPTPAVRILGIPVFCVYKHRTPGIYVNDSTAQASGFPGLPPSPLHYEASLAAQQANRQAALAGVPTCQPVNGVAYSRDEYPFASSKEGGTNTGRQAQVLCVPVAEQSRQGVDLSLFYPTELLQVDNAPFYVIPVPY